MLALVDRVVDALVERLVLTEPEGLVVLVDREVLAEPEDLDVLADVVERDVLADCERLPLALCC